MANPHNTDLYTIGKGVLTIAEFSGGSPGSYIDVGNCSSIEIEPAVERLPHFSSRQNYRLKDKNPVIESTYTVTFDLDEMAAGNLKMFLIGTLTQGYRVLALQGTDKEYALKFTSANPAGPDAVWDLWRVTLSPNGPIQLIGEEYMVMSFSGEGLADTANHSDSPYITVDYEATYTETSQSQSSLSSSSVSV